MHIPRTAGFAARRTYQKVEGVHWLKGYIYADRRPEFRQLLLKDAHLLIGGHMPFIPELDDANWVTVLRHPVDRFISQFRMHQLRLEDECYHRGIDAYLKTFHGRIGNDVLVDNVMTWQLSGGSGSVSDAKHNLAAHFVVIGVFPQVREFWSILETRCQLKHRVLRRANGTKIRESVSDQARQMIADNNSDDMSLWNLALQLGG
jgi:hypothetical protein